MHNDVDSLGFVGFQHAFLEELERTVALLAFDDAASCPVKEVKELLDNAQRQKTASELNAAILTSQSHEKGEFPTSSEHVYVTSGYVFCH
jgi:hypothetical protein